MRIIAGIFKGRRLMSPEDDRVRPTSDKVKEAIFSMIQNELPDARVLDLFAGTGNLGLEALSRGAEYAVFCDSSRASINLVNSNIDYCRAGEFAARDHCDLINADYRRALGELANRKEKFDIIFLDPPYKRGLLPECLLRIRDEKLLADRGLIVCEHFEETLLEDQIAGFSKQKERHYGKVVLSIFI